MKVTRYNFLYIIFLSVALSIWIMLLIFRSEIGNLRITDIIVVSGDVLLIMTPFWWLKRYYGFVLLPVWLIAIFCEINLLYFRFWSDILSSAATTMAGNINGLLIKSAIGLFKTYDIAFLIIPLIATTIYSLSRGKVIKTVSRRSATYYTLASIMVFLISQYAVSLSIRHWRTDTGLPFKEMSEITKERILQPVFKQSDFYLKNGFILYLTKNIASLPKGFRYTKILTDREKDEIKNFISSHNDKRFFNKYICNNAKNVVLIIVESLNAEVINKVVNGFEITPTLNTIINDAGSISSLNIVSQVKEGGSGDGHLLINTGLLPLAEGSASICFVPQNTLPSLTSVLNSHDKAAFFADDGNSWNQKNAFKSFGFDSIYTSENFITSVDKRGRDGAMFDMVLHKIKTLKQPFFIECVTISMHVPFHEDVVETSHALSKSGINETVRNYYSVTNYFDKELDKFLTGLYEIIPKDDIVLIITSDHSQSIATGNELKDESGLPALFIASGTGQSIRLENIAGQVNIYPTILDVLGIEFTPYNYRGLGKSMLDSGLNGAMDAYNNVVGSLDPTFGQAYVLSDNILRSNYFKI